MGCQICFQTLMTSSLTRGITAFFTPPTPIRWTSVVCIRRNTTGTIVLVVGLIFRLDRFPLIRANLEQAIMRLGILTKEVVVEVQVAISTMIRIWLTTTHATAIQSCRAMHGLIGSNSGSTMPHRRMVSLGMVGLLEVWLPLGLSTLVPVG